jgi:DNA-binding transcriptional regulator YhcF (GntR family)
MSKRGVVVYSKARQVADILRSDIVGSKYREDMLFHTETELMKKFSVGRSSVREALSILEHEKLVERKAGRGTVVLKKEFGGKVLFVLDPDEHTNMVLTNPLLKALKPLGGNLSVADNEHILQELPKNWGPGHPFSSIDTLVHFQNFPHIDMNVRHLLDIVGNRPIKPLVIFYDDDRSNLPVNKIILDVEKANCEITEKLISQGHRRFLYYGYYKVVDSVEFPVVRGARKTLSQKKDTSLTIVDYEDRHSMRTLREMFSKKDHPTAVIGGNDFFAAIVMKIALSQGMNVPEDIAFAGQFNTPWSLQVNPSLTSTKIDEEGFTNAVREILKEGKTEEKVFFMPVYRDSTGRGEKEKKRCEKR